MMNEEARGGGGRSTRDGFSPFVEDGDVFGVGVVPAISPSSDFGKNVEFFEALKSLVCRGY